MAKSMTPAQRRKAKRLAEQLKGKSGIKNPFAVANAQVKRGAKRSKKRR